MFCHNLRLPLSQFSAPHPILPCHCQARHRSASSPRPQNTQTGARGAGAECSPSRFMCSTLWPRPITNLDVERRRRFAGGVEIEEQTSLMFKQVAFRVHHFLFLSHRRHPQLTPASSCACAALSYEPARWKHLWPVRTCRAECGGCSYFLFCIRLYWFFFFMGGCSILSSASIRGIVPPASNVGDALISTILSGRSYMVWTQGMRI